MIVRFRAEALEEFADAVMYYNSERSGLGFKFAVEVRNAVDRIKKYPESWPFISKRIRKCLVNRFPYSLLYYQENDLLLVVAVMHLRKKPGYWKDRI